MVEGPCLNLHCYGPALHNPAVLTAHLLQKEAGYICHPRGYSEESQCFKTSEVTVLESRNQRTHLRKPKGLCWLFKQKHLHVKLLFLIVNFSCNATCDLDSEKTFLISEKVKVFFFFF